MKVGFVGLGKLGLPVALAISDAGHDVMGHDTNPDVIKSIVEDRRVPYQEVGADELLQKTNLKTGSLKDVVLHSEMIFVAVQTPHKVQFEGITPLTEEREDFDYNYLLSAVERINWTARVADREVVVAIVSTVLPGTLERLVYLTLDPHTTVIYNPLFIAMGTTIPDFLKPEFVLIGRQNTPKGVAAADKLREFYRTLLGESRYPSIPIPIEVQDVRDAEMTKVLYNVYIGMKIVFANTAMEMCDHMGGNVDVVTRALGLGRTRLMSTNYLFGGMGDGGGCHPRDGIALSWLAREMGLSHDFFTDIMEAREDQTDWLAYRALDEAQVANLPLILLGKTFKPETNLVVGSPAILLRALITRMQRKTRQFKDVVVRHYDRNVDGAEYPLVKAVYFIATKHEHYRKLPYPAGSTVLDPWGYVEPPPDVEVVWIGRPTPSH